MIEQMTQSEGSTLGFAVSGTVTKDDYAVLTPAVEAAIGQFGEVNLVLDLTGFRWEEVSAWGADLRFGHELRHKIARMAIVGNRRWEKHLAGLAAPFYAREAEYFEDGADAWTWVAG